MSAATVDGRESRSETGGEGPWGLPWAVWLLAGCVFLLEMAVGPRYGLFRDEYYYLACADHLAWGYVDQPPLSIAVLAAVAALLGDSLVADPARPGSARRPCSCCWAAGSRAPWAAAGSRGSSPRCRSRSCRSTSARPATTR